MEKFDLGRTRTCNPLIRSQMPYPLGHKTSVVTFYDNYFLLVFKKIATYKKKVGGSSPPGGECFVLLYNYLKHFTQIHPMFFSHQKNYRSLPMWVQCFPLVFWVVGVYYPLRYGLVVRIAGSHPAGSGSIPGTGIFFPNFHLFFQIMFLPLF